jgi:hypothetical protein
MTEELAWGDGGDQIRWSPIAHYDTGFAAVQNNDYLTGLAHAALGLLLLHIQRQT